MTEKKIKYLEHPVTAEEKKKWIEKGFKIVDKAFEPVSVKHVKEVDENADRS